MAHWKKGFSSRYVTAEECEPPIIATIARVAIEPVGLDENKRDKLVLHFREGQSKALIMNITRCQALAAMAGSDDTANWIGVTIRMSKGSTRFQGKKVACIDVDRPPPGPAQAGAPIDDIPF